MKKLSKDKIKKLKKYWEILQGLEDDFYQKVDLLQEKMSSDIGIEDLEFIYIDGYCGIGNVSRKFELIHSEELEEK